MKIIVQLLGNELTTVYSQYHDLLVELASTIDCKKAADYKEACAK